MDRKFRELGQYIAGFGLVLLALALYDDLTNQNLTSFSAVFLTGVGFLVLGLFIHMDFKIKEATATVGGVKLTINLPEAPSQWTSPIIDTPKAELAPEVLEERREIAKTKPTLPGRNAPSFRLLEEKIALSVIPRADPMTPMYMLDTNFRIIDWNDAFSLCFDRSMEGQRGLSVLEWVYFLDNYDEVLEHGRTAFPEGRELPRIDKEELHYTSRSYGVLSAIKRAYQIPDDDGSCLGWLVTIEPTFSDKESAVKYQNDLFTCLRKSLIWSEYALSYDKVLNSTFVYPDLLRTLLGQKQPGPSAIPSQTRILDLGAGTGNITAILMEPSASRLIVAIDNNLMMLNTLRQKCSRGLRQDAEGPGVVAIKQDISALSGLDDAFFDYAILNNVLYSMEDGAVQSCLQETYRVLKAGGEIRISGPQKGTKLSVLFDQIQEDLKTNKKFDELEKDFRKVRDINEHSLAPMLLRWDKDDMEILLKKAGFSEITYSADNVYAGQSMLVCARK